MRHFVVLAVLWGPCLAVSCSDDGSGSSDADSDGDIDTDTDSDTDSDSDTGSDSGADDCADTETITDTDELCWIDESTGLEWQVLPSCTDDGDEQFLLYEATLHCEELALCGFEDWKLPNIGELRTLIRGCPQTETGGECPVEDGYTGDFDCPGCAALDGPDEEGLYWPPVFEGDPELLSSSVHSENRVFVCDFTTARIDVEDPIGDAEHWPEAFSVHCVRPDGLPAPSDAGVDGGE